jgi:hypothetical protein
VSLHEAGDGGFQFFLAPRREKELLQNGVFQDLGRTQKDNRLGRDLDRFAGLGITAHAGFAMSIYDAEVRLKGRPTRGRFRADDEQARSYQFVRRIRTNKRACRYRTITGDWPETGFWEARTIDFSSKGCKERHTTRTL